MPNQTIASLLANLRGGGFNTSLTLRGINIVGQKVVAFEPTGVAGGAASTVFTVNNAGVARATNIASIDSVDF
jgi:hypothetical protein